MGHQSREGSGSAAAGLAGVLFLGALAVPLESQQTWIVDAANGPGAHFTDLPPAVQAAAPGDRILLRPRASGAYNGVPVYLDKALSVIGLGSAAVPVHGGLLFRGTALERMVIANLEVSTAVVNFDQCPGTVVVDGLIARSTPGGGMQVSYSVNRILMTRCRWTRWRGPALYVDRSRLWLLDSRLEDLHCEAQTGFQHAALYATDSDVWVLGSELIGGTPLFQSQYDLYPEWGLAVGHISRTRPGRAFVGPGSRIVGAWTPLSYCAAFPTNEESVKTSYRTSDPGYPPAVLVYDPAVEFVGCRDTNGNELAHEFPMVLPGEALRGQRQDIRAWGPTSSIVAVFASFLPDSDPIPLPIGDVWLDPTFVVHVGSAAVDPNRRVTLSTTIPQWLSPGEVLVYQAVSLSPQSTFELSPPGIAVVR